MTQDQNNDIQKKQEIHAPRTKANPNFEAKRTARIARFSGLADKNEEKAETRFDTASKMAAIIPMGQPILIGHHSEKRDRRYRERIGDNMRKGIEHEKKAEYYRDKASSAERNDAIMSDDPEALTKLNDKIKSLEDSRDFMKLVNKAWRSAGRPKADDAEGWAKVAADPRVKLELIEVTTVRRQMAIVPWQESPYPGYAFQNLNANIKRLKERLAALIAAERREAIAFEINDVRVEEEDGRINVYFPSKPSDEVRQRLKSYPLSLKWSRYSGCWTRKMTESTGTYFIESLKKLCHELT